MLRLKEKYKNEVAKKLQEKFGYKNKAAVPFVEKVVVNSGFGKAVAGKDSSERKKIIDNIMNSLSLITGQKPSLRKARKSISSFKLRKGLPIGAKVTLRGQRMYDFMEKLILLVLPRVRDFRGIEPGKVDKNGNLTIGFRESMPFPELSFEKEKSIFSLEVTVVTKAKTREEALALLRLLGFPIK